MNADQHTNEELYLDVGHGHKLYIHDWGNKQAKTPIIFLHGGPGSATRDGYKQVFEPTKHRVIFFDQRGCGKSLPYGSMEHNTTDELIGDIQKIIKHFAFDQVIVQGGSWGSCLALAYALKHPKSVKALIISGIFTASKWEIDWLASGARTFFPHAWEELLGRTPKQHHGDPYTYHNKRALSADETAAKESAYALTNYEVSIMSLDDRVSPLDPIEFDPAGAKICANYMLHNCFLPERYILNNAHKLHMPVWIVQGRYDMDCPPVTAHELNKKLPNSNIIWTIANHRASERETQSVLRTILLQIGDA